MRLCSITLLMFLAGPAAYCQTIHNITKAGSEFGYKYFEGTAYQQGTPNDGNTVPGIALAYQTDAVFIRDRSRWDLDMGYAHELDNELRFIFRGSGVDINYIGWNQSDTFHWELDGVTSGSLEVLPPLEVRTIPAAAQGTLDPNQIHLLRLWVTDDSEEGILYKAVFVDTFTVYDEQPITRSENHSAGWTFTGDWSELSAVGFPASGGTLAESQTSGDKVTFSFEGTSVAIIGGGHNEATGKYNWKIDDGSQHAGTIDQSLDGDVEAAYRWPDVVVNGLAPGSHTVTIEVAGEGQYLGTGAYVDAIDYISTPPVNAARHWTLF